jgi:TolB-like protein/predicted negative regulator of RcsB-dependent stress response
LSEPSLWGRLRRARVVQVLVVYLAAAWGILQVADIVQGALLLPEWLLPTLLIFLVVGALVIVATAWVQANPSTEAREQAGEVPTDWQVAPRDLGRAVVAGRLPHLTWGRAIAGGVFALALLFGGAGAYVLFTDESNPLVPSEAVASGTLPAIAVLPFTATGADLAVYREGMVDLLTTNLDGFSGYRSIPTRTVLAQWRHATSGNAEPAQDQALRVASVTGARYAVIGSVVATGSQVRLAADLFDLESGGKVGSGTVEGSPDAILDLVDRLSVDVMRTLVGESAGQATTTRQRLAGLVTASVPALKAYLEGEAFFRQSRFNEARDALERAITLDSTFALAYWRLSETIGWADGIFNPAVRRYSARAASLAGRLPPREATILEVADALSQLRSDPWNKLQEYVRRYPEDPEGWYYVAEFGLHLSGRALLSESATYEAMYKAVELDPSFAPYYHHPLEREVLRGDSARFFALLQRFSNVSPGTDRIAILESAWLYYRGTPTEQARAQAMLESLPPDQLNNVIGTFNWRADDLFDRYEAADALRPDPVAGRRERLTHDVARGRWSRVLEAVRGNDPGLTPASRADALLWSYWSFGLGDMAELRTWTEPLRAMRDTLSTCPLLPGCEGVLTLSGMHAALTGDAAARAAVQRDFERVVGQLSALMARGVTDTLDVEPANRAAALRSSATMVRAAAALVDGRAGEALALLEGDTGRRTNSSYAHVFLQAEALHSLGRYRDAAVYYEATLTSRYRPQARLRLGDIYERLGDSEKARQNYAAFLTIWEVADPGLGPLELARAGLARVAPDSRSLSR